ncbi:amylo-alpha-1,6-glucosidase [Mycobacterium sp. KBS0706]|uniref:amylo-alpha-1,6-glucosidase n=1 Tax=Mycobacterium sp. KBS0706 TaxID=2578109 RepID=UPI001C8F7D35|nr:amylo-alpha-1,6-glucosidase [Mycobacterium sp. KBS0706]
MDMAKTALKPSADQVRDTPTMPTFIRFGRAVCGDLREAERREWWLSNGRGAYAAGTVAGSLTRRYHGLLVAPVDPPLGRMLVFAKADATLVQDGRETPLFTNRWAGGAIVPAGHVEIESFQLDGTVPTWIYAVGRTRIEHRIWMEPGADTTYAAWRLLPDPMPAPDMQLRVRLLANGRDHHGQTAVGQFDPQLELHHGALIVDAGRFALTLAASGGDIALDRAWIENFDLPAERERGLFDRDNHLAVGMASLALVPGRWVGLGASLHPDPATDLDAALERRRQHDREVLAAAAAQLGPDGMPDWIAQLTLSADGFLFSRPLPEVPDGVSVIAGYPWFGDWGRDTMIALPGLTLATGRPELARRILDTFARFVDRGMLPNVFPGAGQVPDYNTADAALWFFEAWRAYVEATGDTAALAAVFPVLAEMVNWYRVGTRYGIGVDPADGLLRAGEPGVQLTWMDAKVGDWVVTPRIGKPVEINALWYNALRIMTDFASMLGQSSETYAELAAQVRQGFQRFVSPANGGLYDVIDGPEGDDASVRPNQILAVSLLHSPLDPDRQAAVVALCGQNLLTSYGLRSLSPEDPAFHPAYGGDVWARDGGYHQGPVWAWLLGHYALAEHRVHGDAAAALARLAPVRDHLADSALGHVSEIFDGAAPHRPAGCPAQAWSVACTLEAWWRLRRMAAAPGRP